MARRVVLQRERYRIEFDTSGMGRYWFVTAKEQRGPYNTEDDAKRVAAEWLKAQLSEPGETLAETMAEDERALKAAEVRDQRRFAQPMTDAEEEVDDLILAARTRSARERKRLTTDEESLGKSIAQQLRAQTGKNADPEGKPAPKFKFQKEPDA